MKVRWNIVAFWCLLFLFWYTYPTEGHQESSSAASRPPISLDVYPKRVMCPLGKSAQVRVRTRIDPHADNRFRSLSWESQTGESGASRHQVDGNNDAITFTTFLNVTSGSYLITACVVRKTEGKTKTLCDSATLEVQ